MSFLPPDERGKLRTVAYMVYPRNEPWSFENEFELVRGRWFWRNLVFALWCWKYRLNRAKTIR